MSSLSGNLAEPVPAAPTYEDLLAQWGDLQTTLAFMLARPAQIPDFAAKVAQCDEWLQEMMAKDLDSTLFLVFQLASSQQTGYSSSHALVCAALCHVLAHKFELPRAERNSLVRAAFTMNIGMTALQDELAEQLEPISAQQQAAVNLHAETGAALLMQLGVTDALWLGTVARHHAPQPERTQDSLAIIEPQSRLVQILSAVDRYGALISPRKSRSGRNAAESIRTLLSKSALPSDEVGFVLARTVGLCPPGTFVKLDNGDTAIVLRRGESPSYPIVASLVDAEGEPYPDPELHYTIHGRTRIVGAQSGSAVNIGTNHYTMVRMGMMAGSAAHA